ncbi:class I SAM-dependent methyltransferase [candidate division KSB1 bacterium]|nr:class I SAM-dependent methyltransferase [candidate division KSB1 bacterium]
MFDFHSDKRNYFDIQYENSKESIVPFVSTYMQLDESTRVLEIGSAEAGVLKAFTDLGCQCTGIELSPERVELARKLMKPEMEAGKVRFFAKNIYDIDLKKDIGFKYDLIILKDVIEHIRDQEKFIPFMTNFLNPQGKVFFGFPPWYHPFGGHQQMCDHKIPARTPYIHLLPKPAYKLYLKLFGEKKEKIEMFMEVKETGISIERFERIAKKNNFQILDRILYFIPPIYKYKFKLQPKKLNSSITRIPYIRNFFSMSAYYIIQQTNR